MTTPNIEELIASFTQTNQFHENADICTADVIDVLKSQAERIAELEVENKLLSGIQENTEEENKTLRAQLAESISNHAACKSANSMLLDEIVAIAAAEPVARAMSGKTNTGFVYARVLADELTLGTELFTRPMPAQDVTELVEALELAVKLNSFREFNDHIPAMRDALSKYKGAK